MSTLGANNGTILFTGQSLGGALAQYGSAEYIVRQRGEAAELGHSYTPSNISLLTFNALGGRAGLAAHGIGEAVFSGIGAVSHYVVDSDVVSRFGGGHAGANGEVIKLDWTYLGGTSLGKPMDVGDSHRIETAFYTHLDALGTALAGRTVIEGSADQPLLNTPNAVAWANAFGQLFNDLDVTAAEAPSRLLAGFLGAGLSTGAADEINTVIRAMLDIQYRAGKLTDAQYLFLKSVPWNIAATQFSSSQTGLGVLASSEITAAIADAMKRMTPAERQKIASMTEAEKKAIVKGFANTESRWVMGPNGPVPINGPIQRTGRIPTAWGGAQQAQRTRVDPLVLDLDGDGLESVGINSDHPVMFDLAANGVQQSVGWVKGDDGFLVRDLNGNGTIDSGAELFGDATPLTTGPNAGQKAANGFAALADLDSTADGQITSADSAFASLKVWRDLNQDGIAQSYELSSLADQNIVALNVSATSHSTTLVNGNRIADLGSYVRSDGSAVTLGDAGLTGDIDLAVDTFHTQFVDTLPITPEAEALPDMQGAGQVRTLREAASVNGSLATLLTQFASATTRSAQMALMDGILKEWSNTSTMATTFTGAYTGHALTVNIQGASGAAYTAWAEKLSLLERFNGRTFNAVPAGTGTEKPFLTEFGSAANEAEWGRAA